MSSNSETGLAELSPNCHTLAVIAHSLISNMTLPQGPDTQKVVNTQVAGSTVSFISIQDLLGSADVSLSDA